MEQLIKENEKYRAYFQKIANLMDNDATIMLSEKERLQGVEEAFNMYFDECRVI